MSEENVIAVGLGEMKVGREARDVLVAYGLGSCVGISAYCPVKKVGVMAHVMLPEPSESKPEAKSAKFATQAIPMMMETIKGLGCPSSRIIWRIAGGAQVLSVPGMNGRLMVGERNVAMVKKMMEQFRLPITAEDTGGRQGRTMQFFVETGKVTVRSVGGPQREL
jgi:chemotaxis protein CheD